MVGSDPAPERVRLAEELGLVDVGVSDPRELDDAVAAATGDAGCEVAVDCSGHPAARESALRNTRARGRCVFVGEGGQVSFAVSDLLIHKQVTLHGSWVTSLLHMEELLERLVRWGLRPERIVSHRYPLAEAGEAYRVASAGRSGEVCIVWED